MAVSDRRASLTPRQREIYEFLKDKIQNRGYGPTVREIGEHFKIRSPNGVMCHLKAIERKGLIRRESNMSRAICLADTAKQNLSLPLIGTAVSGRPIQSAVSSDELVEFDPMFVGSEKACIQVKGTAFQSLGIADGDYIIVRRGADGPVGGLVAALDDRHCVTLCRIQDCGRQLTPAVPGAFPAATRQVLGTVVGVIRQFKDSLNGAPVSAPPAPPAPPAASEVAEVAEVVTRTVPVA
ncbi:MAG: transcriptional repressor LexA [Fuerstiella sp.]